MASSSHLVQVPQAVRIAASQDPSVDPSLKEGAINYLDEVRRRSDETWQDCLALYLQGAGAAGPSSSGRDGKQKLDPELRLFCEQIVVTRLADSRPIATEAQQAVSSALVDFVRTEWVDGPRESGQSFFRNKLAYMIALLFINVYPTPIPSFLHPFFELLQPPAASSSTPNFDAPLLALRILNEIAQEIHDSTLRSARTFSGQRQNRDGVIRDAIRSTGDERLAIDGLMTLAESALGVLEQGASDKGKWLELADYSLKTLASWIPWVDLSVALTPKSLSLYHRFLQSSYTPLRTSTTAIMRIFVAKGIKEPSEKLEVMKVLNVLSLLDPLESQTRGAPDDAMVTFRAGLGGILAAYGTELIALTEVEEATEAIRNEAEGMLNESLPLLLRFLGDRSNEVPLSVSTLVSDLLRVYKKVYVSKAVQGPPVRGVMPPPPPPMPPLPDSKRQFLSSLLDVLIRKLAWPDDAEWEAPGGEDPDPGDDLAVFQQLRIACKSYIESISLVDKTLHTEVVANIVISTLSALQSQGSSVVSWQQVELALHLVYTFAEVLKNNTRAAFYELPPDLLAKRDKVRRDSFSKMAGIDTSMSSGRTTPVNGVNGDDQLGQQLQSKPETVDYSQYPLTPLGQLLVLCMSSGVSSYPHPSVVLQYFEICVRYVDFWKSKAGAVHPVFEAMLDSRGIHQADEAVRRRCFYLFTKFVKECRSELDPEMVPPILQSMRDVMVIETKLPEPDTPDEDVLVKATKGKSYIQDQFHLFEAAGNLVYVTRTDPDRHVQLLEALVGPLMSTIGSGLDRYRQNPSDLQAVLEVHDHLLALGNFAKGFPTVSDKQLEALPYTPPFKQMTEALLQALEVMKTQRIVRDSARFSFSQFVTAIGSTVAELVPQFVSAVVTEFEPSELNDFMMFLSLLMHRMKRNTFETIDMLLLPLLSRIFSILSSPVTGTDDATIQRQLKGSYLTFFTSLMNSNLDGVFISDRNKPEFENVLSTLLNMARECSDPQSQRLAFSFFAKSVIAWGTSPDAAAAPSVFADSARSAQSKAVANGLASATNQHAIEKGERAAQALPGYEQFIYGQLVPLCFEIPADSKFNIKTGLSVLFEIAMLLRNTLEARGQEAIDFLLNDLLPKLQCPRETADQLVLQLRTQQAKDVRQFFATWVKSTRR